MKMIVTTRNMLRLVPLSALVIAVFAVGAMLSAYTSSSNSATPRAFPLVVGDDVSQAELAFRYAEQSLRLPEALESLQSVARPETGGKA